MTWLDLYDFLNKQANEIKNIGNFDWKNPVLVYDGNTGEETECETIQWLYKNQKDYYVIATNIKISKELDNNGS